MPILDKKIAAFTKDVSDLADRPNQTGMNAAQVKAQFDAAPNELRVALNSVIDVLIGVVAGDSGAENIGSALIQGLTGDTVFEQLTSLKSIIDNNATTAHNEVVGVTLGQIPDGSLTPDKFNNVTQSELAGATIYLYKNLGGL